VEKEEIRKESRKGQVEKTVTFELNGRGHKGKRKLKKQKQTPKS